MSRLRLTTTRRRVLLAAAAGAFACQAPFGSDRHDVASDRIVAITTTQGFLRPVVAVDGWLGRNDAARFTWYLLAPGAGLPPADASVTPWSTDTAIAAAPGHYGLRVVFPSGTVREAVLTLQTTTAPAVEGIRFEHVDLPFAPMDDEEALAAGARLDQPTSDLLGPAEPGRWVRARAAVAAEAVDRVRWMQQGPSGDVGVTFLELDATSTDLALGELTLDDLAIEESTPTVPGVRTILALALGPFGAHTLASRDLEVGTGDAALVRWGDALLPADTRAEGPGTATLLADPSAAIGVRAEAVRAGSDEALASPACAGDGPPLAALLDGRCAPSDLDGFDVAVEAP